MKKCVVVGISGSIAAYKAANFVRLLQKNDYEVEVILTKHATKFITPLTFESLLKKPVYTDLFDKTEGYQIKHIELAKKADCFVVMPASANIISKIANGIADDMLSTTILAATCKKIIAPAMNVNMYLNTATQRNIEQCKKDGIYFVEPNEGLLACGDVGKGKLAKEQDILSMVQYCLEQKPLLHQNVLITAGPTIEAIDPVRFISNHSSGKMGYALAKKAFELGANVTLITGPTSLSIPYGTNPIFVESAKEMYEAVKENYNDQDFIIKAAAVGDYAPKEIASDKIKKSNETLMLELKQNQDILKYLGLHKTHQILCGFAMETTLLKENAKKKQVEKNCDLIVANNLKEKGAGFKTDTNKVLLISDKEIIEKPLMSKESLSKEILLKLIELKGEKDANSN